jgi:hypothetical protein
VDPSGEPEEEREEEGTLTCADCGAATYAADRAYAFGSEQLLCWQCAERRGGRYDARQERWSHPPDVANLRRGLDPAE